jgi:hypothetical protein
VNFQRWERGWWLACSVFAASCSLTTRFAQTASEPGVDAGSGSVFDAATPVVDASTGIPVGRPDATVPDSGPMVMPPAPSCPGELADRITVTRIDVDADIRYRTATYDNFPMDERIGFGVARDGRMYVAWTDPAGAVHVTPLDSDLKRAASDIVVPGQDLGGFVVRDDGFALLTRREDPGQPLTDPNTGNSTPVKAAFLVRYRDGTEVFASPLTGTRSITASADPRARDCAPMYLYGRLAWNGARYGAYFHVHGCTGDPHQSYYADKLVYADDRGRYSAGGWSWNCSNNIGLRLLAEPGAFTAVCFADFNPAPGLNLVTEGVPPRQLSPEYTVANYVGAAFGSIMKIPADGSYALGWLSRGVTTAQGRSAAAKSAYDIALLRLGPDYVPLGKKKWLVETDDVAEINLHLAPWGRDRLFMTWERVENPRCTDRTCWGPYSGTRARLLDLDGNALSADFNLTAPPNTGEDITVFPNGDLGWVFVADDDRSYQNPVRSDVRPPSKRQLSIARLRVCE